MTHGWLSSPPYPHGACLGWPHAAWKEPTDAAPAAAALFAPPAAPWVGSSGREGADGVAKLDTNTHTPHSAARQ